MRATTTSENAGAAGSAASTSSPAMVRDSCSTADAIGGLHSVRNQLSENFIGAPSRELSQEAQVVLIKHPQVVDAITRHREAIGAHAKCKSLVTLRIDTHGAQH